LHGFLPLREGRLRPNKLQASPGISKEPKPQMLVATDEAEREKKGVHAN